ncbi:MAG: membrane protein insertase YidC, partial [Bacteroidales bacterium]|nr:membrane protein insertase YidC [Bacteroidales bacterium]
GYAYWTSPSLEERQAAQENARKAGQTTEETVPQAQAESPAGTAPAPTETASSAASPDPNHPFSFATVGETTDYTIENDVFQVDFRNLGGRIAGIRLKDYKTYDQQTLTLFDAAASDFYLSFFANNRHIRTDGLYFECLMPATTRISGNDSARVRMRLYAQTPDRTPDSTRYMEWVYTVRGTAYDIGMRLNIVGMQDLIAINSPFIDLVWQQRLQQFEKAVNMEQMNTALFYKPLNDHAEQLKQNRDQTKDLTFPLRWIAFKQQFFSVCLTADGDFSSARVQQKAYPENPYGYLKDMQAEIGLGYDHESVEHIDLTLFAGPNKYKILKEYGTDMERLIPLGWGFFLLQWVNRFAVIPVFDFLESKGLNYGLIILILTILLKIILSPVTYKSYLSSAKMRVIQPEVEIINKRYPKQ